MLNDLERKLIEQLQSEEELNVYIKIASDSKNPFFLQEYAISYNWDDGYELPTSIANNKCCDLGTALELFWLSEAMWLYTGESKRDKYSNDWADFCEMITECLIQGFYKHGPVSFCPDINRLTEYKFKKSNIPAILFSEVVGV